MIQRASITKILMVDYTAFFTMIAIPVVWIVYFLFLFTGNGGQDNWKIIAILGAATLACLAVMFWRVNLIQSVFEDGWETEAIISSLGFYKDRGRVEYTYKFGNVGYKTGNAVMKSWITRVQQVGGTTVVMVDRNRPKRAFLRDLYLSESAIGLSLVKNGEEAGAGMNAEPGTRIAFQGALDQRAFFKAAWLVNRPSKGQLVWRTGLVVFFVAIITAGFVYNGLAIPQMSALEWFRYLIRPALVVLAGLVAIFEPLIESTIAASRQWSARQRQFQIAGDQTEVSKVVGNIDFQGIHYIKSSGGTVFQPWSKFIRMRVDKYQFALVTGSGEVHAFPLNFFQNEKDWIKTDLLARIMVRPVDRRARLLKS